MFYIFLLSETVCKDKYCNVFGVGTSMVAQNNEPLRRECRSNERGSPEMNYRFRCARYLTPDCRNSRNGTVRNGVRYPVRITPI
jgi:hypothetical protein